MKKIFALLLLMPLFLACSSDDDDNKDDNGDNGVNVLVNTVWSETIERGTTYFRFTDDKYCVYEWYNYWDKDPTSTNNYKYSYSAKDKTVTIMTYSNHKLAIGSVSDNKMTFTLNKIEYNLTKE